MDLFFPPSCVVCGKRAEKWICEKCDKYVSKYLNKSSIQGNKYYLFEYKDIIRKLMLVYKFYDANYISHFFVNEIIKNEKIIGKLFFYDIIIPVPMNYKKQKVRGYNQSSLVSKELAHKTKKLYLPVMYKKEGIKQQAKLTRKERMQNIKNAFYIKECDRSLIQGKNVVLIDDIYTTGSTVNECKRVLQNSGVNQVFVITFTRDFNE